MREEQPADMLARLGSDGLLWAQEFNKTAVRLGYSEMDEGWLIGWFANAIEHSCNPLRNECYRLREENARLREALIDTLASLVASVDLLECGGKKAAPSDKMFEQMLVDYKNTIERGRYAAAIREKRSFATEGGKDE